MDPSVGNLDLNEDIRPSDPDIKDFKYQIINTKSKTPDRGRFEADIDNEEYEYEDV